MVSVYPALSVLATLSCFPLDLPCYNSSAEVIFIALHCHAADDFKQPTFLWKPCHMRKSQNKKESLNTMKSHNQTKEEKLNLLNFLGTSTECGNYEDYLWHLDPVLCHVRRHHRTSRQL